MFGRYFRAALTIPIAVLAAAILEWIGPMFLPYVGPESGPLHTAFSALIENALIIMLAAIAAAVLAGAVVESNARGV